MSRQLRISVGQHSDKGRKETNQDFHGVYVPEEPLLTSKGIAIALADGISSSDVSHIASESAVKGFLEDYVCTSEAWSVKKSAHRVLAATNSWLHSQSRQSQYRYEKDRGYVCTLSAMIVKSTTAYIFHMGDSRIYQLHGKTLEQLTIDHRMWVSGDTSYLSRAMGMNPQLEIDFESVPVKVGDIFMLATDGVYEHAGSKCMVEAINNYRDDLNEAARVIVDEAYQNGSDDNLTVQIVRIDDLPAQDADELYQKLTELPFPPMLEARAEFDGYKIVRKLHASSRSHVYLAVDIETDVTVVLKTPSIDLQSDSAYLERFLMEEWVARRINSPYVLKPSLQTRKRNFLYIVTEYIDGQNLTQWMIDNPRPDLETVRGIVEQIAKGLRAFHRLEMLHQDLRPDNVMIDVTGTVKIIDFGSAKVAGIMEINSVLEHNHILGTAQYTAPEYFLGEIGSSRSDIFSLGVITYQMLTGKLPYGAQVAKSRSKAAQRKLKYRSVLADDRDIPVWVDGVIRKAVQTNPFKRYGELSSLVYDLRHPNKDLYNQHGAPLLERNPVLFWKGICFILAIIIVVILI